MVKSRVIILCMGVTLILGVQQVFASGSGGFRNESPDAAAFSKGSAFVGEANNPSAVYYNPAGINQIKSFTISSGGALIGPQIDYKSTNGDKVQARRNIFLVPHIYAVTPISEKLSLGFGSSSYWGLSTEWAQDSFSKYVAIKSELANVDTMITASYQATEQWSFAVSADNDDSKASKNRSFYNFGFGSDGDLQIKAKDNAWGYRLATLFKINEQNQVGLMYRSAIHHKYKGKLYIDGINPAVYGAAGFTNTSYETRITEKLTLPQSIVMGYSFKPTKKWTFNFDLEWINWSKIKQELLDYPDETNAGRLSVLNTGNPAPRSWHSQFSQSIGVEYAATETLRLRTGYYHHQHVIPEGTFESSLPDSNSHGVTVGFGYDFTQHLTLDLGYSALYYETRKINNGVNGGVTGVDINGEYKQFTHVGMATITCEF